MENKFERYVERHDAVVPEHIMEIMRQRRGLDEDDTSEDKEILEMSGLDFLDEWLCWEGILGYTYHILEIIKMAYGISFEDWPFNETIKREIGD